MIYGYYITLFGLSTFKFMYAPIYGRGVGFSFWETCLVTFLGGAAMAIFSYFLAGYFIARAAKKRLHKRLEALYNNEVYIDPKKFTFTNKMIVKVKRTIGILGITFYVPFFLSVPLGTIVVAKFYANRRMTLPLILIGLAKNAFITTSIVYFIW